MTDDAEVIAGRYRLLVRVGRGATGVVWRARDELLDRIVAVKQLDATTGTAGQRGKREARVSARLRHPHAITVHDLAEHGGKLYLVMEFLPSSLAGMLLEHGTLPPAYVAKVGAQVASALAAAHAEGIIHRDVTPGNVLVTGEGKAVIADFGISRAQGEASVTGRGFIAGTPAYLAPEVAGGAEAGFASDVFSLGATLYTTMEGKPPFGTSESVLALLVRIAHDDVNPPTHRGPLADVVLGMLRREAGERPDMAQVNEALAAVAEGRSGPPVEPPIEWPVEEPVELTAESTRRLPGPPPPRRSRRWRLAAVAAAAAGLAAAGLAGVSAGGDGSGGGTAGPVAAAAPRSMPGLTGSPSASATEAKAPAGCDARYQVTQSWQTGYQVLVTVRNVNRVRINGWVVRWTLPAGHRINDVWNGSLRQSGSSVAVTNASWNGVLPADASTDFGLIGLSRVGGAVPVALICQAL